MSTRDGELLGRFVGSGDEEAFEELVAQHGSMVWNVCRRVLGNDEDVEDACQATFIVLARRAASLRAASAVGGWLHGVALRVSLRARTKRAGRREVEQTMDRFGADEREEREEAWAKCAPVLDAELARLPERLRTPIVLHHLEGRTLKEAAAAAGTSLATLRRRLDEGRARLRTRMARSGAALGATLLALLLSEEARGGAWPSSLASDAVRAGLSAGSQGTALATAGSGGAKLLAKEVLSMMVVKQVVKIAATAAASLAVAAAVLVAVYLASGSPAVAGAAETSGPEPHLSAAPRDADEIQPALAAGGESLPHEKATAGEAEELSRGNNAFAADMYAHLATAEEGNLFFSPFSIRTALAMTYAGARGTTAAEMKKALRFTLSDARLHAAFKAAAHSLTSDEKHGHTLRVANALWGQRGYTFLKPFLDTNETFYGGGLNLVDFVNRTEASRKSINLWVEDNTQKKIKNLIPPGGVDKDTRLVLTNAVYFFGHWEKAFDKKLTKPAAFHLDSKRTIQADMMNMMKSPPRTGEWGDETIQKVRYLKRPGFQAVELPYRGNAASMVVFLPDSADGVRALERELCADGGTVLRDGLRTLNASHPQEVDVFLPKWKTTWGMKDLGPRGTQTLSQLGIREAFRWPGADFSGMDGSRKLYIGGVLHKAFIDVNEEGTEAAAATAVMMRPEAPPAPPPVFRADRPFMFSIQDKGTGQILFMGRVADPRS
jgi:serpin B